MKWGIPFFVIIVPLKASIHSPIVESLLFFAMEMASFNIMSSIGSSIISASERRNLSPSCFTIPCVTNSTITA